MVKQVLHYPISSPILDIGTGTGLLAKHLKLSVIGVDFSHKMLKQNHGIRCQADWASLPFKDESFATIFSISALQTNLNKPMKKLTEMRRVLKPSGRFYLSVLKTEDITEVQLIYEL